MAGTLIVPPAGLEPALSAPEADALSTELWGHSSHAFYRASGGHVKPRTRSLYRGDPLARVGDICYDEVTGI